MTWTLDTPTWPIHRRDNDLTDQQILDVLDLVGRQGSDQGTETSGEEEHRG